MKKNITIYTDASFCSDTKAAGGAFWARTDVSRAQMSYPLENVRQSHEAEIMAATIAIEKIIRGETDIRIEEPSECRIVLVIDCMSVKHCFSFNALSCSQESGLKERVRILMEELKEKEITLIVNHVKAHTGKADSRSWVNKQCDYMARAEMKKMRGKNDALSLSRK